MAPTSAEFDATYEGDLYAAAGAEYRLGREARDGFDEPHAGVVYFDYQEKKFLPGTTGEASKDLPAFTYRLCLTKDPKNSHKLSKPPPGYDRSVYLGYFDDLKSGRLAAPKTFKPGRGYNAAHFDTLVRTLSVTPIPCSPEMTPPSSCASCMMRSTTRSATCRSILRRPTSMATWISTSP